LSSLVFRSGCATNWISAGRDEGWDEPGRGTLRGEVFEDMEGTV